MLSMEELVAIRRDFHQHPELAGEETRSQKVLLEWLERLGIEAKTLAGTGVVGLVRGAADGPCIMLRADMDGLPVTDEKDVEYRSQQAGCMHACGHDAHMAILLGAASALVEEPPAAGSVKLVFQPAEEQGAGAKAMIESGVLEDPKVDAAMALHVWSPMPAGRAVARPGSIMASVDSFSMRVRGRSTHAARPEEGCDPIPVAAGIITAAQTLVSRRVAPYERAVLSFTSIHAGTAFNVIPETVEMKGTIRALNPEVRKMLTEHLGQQAQHLAASMEASMELSWSERLPVLENDADLIKLARDQAGSLELSDMEPLMVGEDFALFAERIPAAMLILGAGPKDPEKVIPHHHPRFDIDESVLPQGARWLANCARVYLQG